MKVLAKIKYRYFIAGGLLGLCVSVVIGLLFPTNNISTDIAMIFSLYIVPFMLIVHICEKNKFKFSQLLKPVKFRPVKELALPIIMVELLNWGILFLIAAVMMISFSGIGLEDTTTSAVDWNPIMRFLTLVVLAPFFEEVIFRWFLFHKLAIKNTPLKAMVLSSLIFGILHLENVVPTTMIGIVLCVVFMKYKSLFPCIIIHLFHNVFVFLITYYTQEATDTTIDAGLPDAEMLLILAAILLAVGLTWFVRFLKTNRDYIKGYYSAEK